MPYKTNVIKYVQTKGEEELFFPLEKQNQVQIEPEEIREESSCAENYRNYKKDTEKQWLKDGAITLVSLSVNIILLFLVAFLLFSKTVDHFNKNVETLEETEIEADILDDGNDFRTEVTSTEKYLTSELTSTPGPVTIPSPVPSFFCPNELTIFPCTCSKNSEDGDDDNDSDGLKLLCAGPEVTQNSVDLIFTQLREVNSVGNSSQKRENDRVLELQSFKLLGTLLSSLDLTPLTHSKIRKVTLYMNPILASIFGPLDSNFNPKSQDDLYSLQREFEGSIQVEDLRVDDCALTNEGLGESLKYFDPLTLKNLAITHTRIKGKGTDKKSYEFLPRLWSFENLVMLDLSDNMISVLGHGQFYGLGNSKLSVLYLRGNRISDIDENAFDLGQTYSGSAPDPDAEYFSDDENETTSTDGKSNRLLINLNHNQLTQDIFKGMNETGLTSTNRPISLLLWENQITFLPEDSFRPFLETNEENELFLWDNFIICPDERMNWTREFQKQIFGYNCVY